MKIPILEWVKRKVRQKIAEIVTEEIQVGGHCGICGKWIPNELFERWWAWGICDKCRKGEGKTQV